ncbi:VTT domain-containing protein [Tenacibaculum sp.]|nr:VTT domain-containing protein [Tenacibaculum sp.]
MVEKGKKIVYYLWLVILLTLVIVYFIKPEITMAEYLVNFIKSFHQEMLGVYIILTLIRGFFLIPSTPFVIGGGLLFPNQLLLVLTISMIGVLFSATALYYFSDLLGFSSYLNKKFPSKIELCKKELANSKSILLVSIWSVFPLVPTDLVCYITGILKTPFKNVLLGVFIGELLLCSLYVYFGAILLSCI